MKTNLQVIQDVINSIEKDLGNKFDITKISENHGYSKYHFHKMFTSIVKLSPHQYIKRRRLTEAAKLILSTERSIIDIAISSGYESQQSFTDAFKSVFKISPGRIRKKFKNLEFTLKFNKDEYDKYLSKDDLCSFKIVDKSEINLAGFCADTIRGFFVIPRLWKLLQKSKNKILNRKSTDKVFAYNDYSNSFNYYACVDVNDIDGIDSQFVTVSLPAGRYAVFTFRAKPEDSAEEVISYIYKSWFPSNSYQLNENSMYEIIEYGEALDNKGQTEISICIPIKS